jgi:hypothetical protein
MITQGAKMTLFDGCEPQASTQAAIVTCSDCGEKTVLKDTIHIGLEVCCQNCEAELTVVKLTPVELDGTIHVSVEERAFLARW